MSYQRPHNEPARPQSIRNSITYEPDRQNMPVQKCCRVPRWVSEAILQFAEIHNQSESAVMRTALMDFASGLLENKDRVEP
jgi:hypothetical protein